MKRIVCKDCCKMITLQVYDWKSRKVALCWYEPLNYDVYTKVCVIHGLWKYFVDHLRGVGSADLLFVLHFGVTQDQFSESAGWVALVVQVLPSTLGFESPP